MYLYGKSRSITSQSICLLDIKDRVLLDQSHLFIRLYLNATNDLIRKLLFIIGLDHSLSDEVTFGLKIDND